MVDEVFGDPRLASIYDVADDHRGDLDVYLWIASEFGATTALDVGCGTGTFALLLAENDFEVTGIDPASAALDVARAKPGAERVQWIEGDARSLPRLQVDRDHDRERRAGHRRPEGLGCDA